MNYFNGTRLSLILVKYAAVLFNASVIDNYCGLNFLFPSALLLLENLLVACSLAFPSLPVKEMNVVRGGEVPFGLQVVPFE